MSDQAWYQLSALHRETLETLARYHEKGFEYVSARWIRRGLPPLKVLERKGLVVRRRNEAENWDDFALSETGVALIESQPHSPAAPFEIPSLTATQPEEDCQQAYQEAVDLLRIRDAHLREREREIEALHAALNDILAAAHDVKAHLEAMPHSHKDDIPLNEIIENANAAYGYTLKIVDAVEAVRKG